MDIYNIQIFAKIFTKNWINKLGVGVASFLRSDLKHCNRVVCKNNLEKFVKVKSTLNVCVVYNPPNSMSPKFLSNFQFL